MARYIYYHVKHDPSLSLKFLTCAINAAQPLGLGKLYYEPKRYTYDEIRASIPEAMSSDRWTIDYHKGRSVKLVCCIENGIAEFRVDLYERDNQCQLAKLFEKETGIKPHAVRDFQ